MGKITLRLTKTLHAEVKDWAERRGISIHRFVLLALMEKLARSERAQEGVPAEVTQRMDAVLAATEGQDEDLYAFVQAKVEARSRGPLPGDELSDGIPLDKRSEDDPQPRSQTDHGIISVKPRK